jgi:hypothetical protein
VRVHAGAAPPAVAVHGYETQYLLTSAEGEIDVAALREAITAVGASVIVAGDTSQARIHVHGERPDLAIAAGLPFGRLSGVEITDLDRQVADSESTAGPGPSHDHDDGPAQDHHDGLRHGHDTAGSQAGTIAVVAVTRAPGLADVLRSLGARIVRPGHGTRPSVGEIAEGVLASGAREVIVLPNDRDALLAASQAVAMAPLVEVAVIPTRNAAEGIAAAIAFDPTVSLAENVERMREASAGLRSFTVLTAARDSVIDGQPIGRGQVIALDASRRLLAAGGEVEAVTMQALGQIAAFELVTLYCGDSEGPGQGLALGERIELAGWGAEVEVVRGGQLHDHLLVAVE